MKPKGRNNRVESLLEFAGGPLFRLTFALMVLGLARILILDLWGIWEAYRKAGDKKIPWALTLSRTLEWIFPVRRLLHRRPVYSIFAILFHMGLIIVPIFLFAHVQLWEQAIGLKWITLSKGWADLLTLGTIAFGLAIFLGRVGSGRARAISRKQDYLWPLVLIVPFITGYICANGEVSARTYQVLMLTHMGSAELIFVLLPFTKIAHCVLMPLSQLVSTLAWKFPARVDEDVCATLDKKGAPV
jgi:nitrate reductase gamma subunit